MPVSLMCRPIFVSVMGIMTAVTTMHEQVHDRTQQQDEVRQSVDEMGPVLSQQEIQDRTDQADSGEAVRGQPEISLRTTHYARDQQYRAYGAGDKSGAASLPAAKRGPQIGDNCLHV